MTLKQPEALLVETLTQAGVAESDAKKAKVISWSGENELENSRVHSDTNATIFRLLQRNELGKCVHVTGGARALTDPYHRQMCEAIREDHQQPFQVLYHVPKGLSDGDWQVVNWNLHQWGQKGFSDWQQKLLTLDMIGKRAVKLKSYDERSRIQYSVFGNRYIQVQGRHEDTALAKYIWLIESENINGSLAASADQDLENASDIDETIFSGFVAALFTSTARRLMLKLLNKPNVTKEALLDDKSILAIDPSASQKLSALEIMGFITKSETGQLTVSKDGQSFLRSV